MGSSVDLSSRESAKVTTEHVAREARNDGPERRVPREDRSTELPQIIFFGNGMLADFTLEILAKHCNIIFHARSKEDLTTAVQLKKQYPEAFGILASFGVMIKNDVLETFAPESILNLHPSKLPAYRGASPIESAILAGDTDFSYSIMRLVKAMDAGPTYHQDTLKNLPLDKTTIYKSLATAGATWLVENLCRVRSLTPTPQDDAKATFTTKLSKKDSTLHPEQHTAQEIFRQIVAYQGFPKPKYEFYGKTCIIWESHVVDTNTIVCDPSLAPELSSPLMLKCADRNFVAIDRLQPEGKKTMDAISFMNGYAKPWQDRAQKALIPTFYHKLSKMSSQNLLLVLN